MYIKTLSHSHFYCHFALLSFDFCLIYCHLIWRVDFIVGYSFHIEYYLWLRMEFDLKRKVIFKENFLSQFFFSRLLYYIPIQIDMNTKLATVNQTKSIHFRSIGFKDDGTWAWTSAPIALQDNPATFTIGSCFLLESTRECTFLKIWIEFDE